MDSKKKQAESSSSRAKVWSSVVATALGAAVSLISAISGTADILDVSKEWYATVTAAVATVVVTASFTSVLAHRERGSSKIAKLKDDITAAYLGALESSALNPSKGGNR